MKKSVVDENEEKENQVNQLNVLQPSGEGFIPYPSSTPGLILMKLKQAKLNLTKTTNDLADVRTSVESLNKRLEKRDTKEFRQLVLVEFFLAKGEENEKI